MWFSILFGLFLMVVAVMMLIRHARVWKCMQTAEMNDRERDFFDRQYRRRLQANTLIVIVGVAIIVGVWVTDSLTAAVYWLIVVLLVGWMALLAVINLVSTRLHYGLLDQEQVSARTMLEVELRQIRKRGSNGQAKTKPPEELE